ncbi:MAG TPA: sigma-54 dependent transcriptional regulator [Syntrophorhabdaceae bacterium]|nr:sigma-54 dependent transcriptional regulator [Syntrophorhabdaceae bacterium]HQM82024.1 sigma-54 dependent transcriptional regulator [Syntrophorhabdaceae bacterium]
MKKKKILIIDDEQSLLESLEMFLSEKGYDVCCTLSAAEGVKKNESFAPDIVILDIRLPDKNGLDVLQELRQRHNEKNIIIITAFHDMETTITAMKLGACEYIPKPIDIEELEKAIDRALKVGSLKRGADAISLDPSSMYEKGKIIGKSKAMKEIFKSIGLLSENTVTVLIEGETGTGKELIARAIHYHSPHKDQPLLAINCSAIVGTLLESELFGHEKGSFTGAIASKKGKFELAGDGTIFLDEVSEIPFELQAKLLRFLQEKEFEHVGGEKNLKSNARVIAATNRDLKEMVKNGGFREDLYYRLSVATINVPPLRERKSDIPLLIEYIIRKINAELHRSIKKVEEKAIHRLMSYDWPGNVRELENILTRAAITTQGEVVLDEFISPLLGWEEMAAEEKNAARIMSLQEIEKTHILRVLSHAHWHLGNSCKLLGISRPTLRQKLKEYGISIQPDSP